MIKSVSIFITFIQFFLNGFAQPKSHPFVLKANDFKHHVDYFNKMEDENITQAISNKQSWDWMKHNVPLFECPQQNFEEIFYYRWWTLRKHIKKNRPRLCLY